nr:unnamed protein product [Callosobruchus analis]
MASTIRKGVEKQWGITTTAQMVFGGMLSAGTNPHCIRKTMPKTTRSTSTAITVMGVDHYAAVARRVDFVTMDYGLHSKKRLSRGRNVVENVFGFIAARFRILHTPINVSVDKVSYFVMAICVLHNFLKKRASAYVGGNAFDSVNATTHEINYNAEWRENGVQLVGLRPVRQGTYSEAKTNRDKYVTYFNEEGAVPWQEDIRVHKNRKAAGEQSLDDSIVQHSLSDAVIKEHIKNEYDSSTFRLSRPNPEYVRTLNGEKYILALTRRYPFTRSAGVAANKMSEALQNVLRKEKALSTEQYRD